MAPRLLDADEAAALVPDEKAVVGGGSGGIGVADTVLAAVAARFRATGHPRGLTLIHTTGVGDFATRGMGHLALAGLARRVIGGNYGPQPRFMKLITANLVEAYNFPQGVMAQMFRAVAAKQPGVITHVGLHTYMDARQTGGKMNAAAQEDLVELVSLAGQEWLFYKAFPTDVAILRGTTADEDGNISLEHEAASLEGLSIAQAVHNAGGVVICQVKRLARRGHLHPQMVRIPGILVDALVLAPDQPQTFGTQYDASMSGEVPCPLSTIVPGRLTERRVIARRAAMALRRGAVVNLGVGMATGIPNVAAEEGIEDLVTLTVESGIVGGVPGAGLDFGAATNARAVMDQAYLFDFYDGGGLDIGFLSFAQVGATGDVNVTKFGNRADGCGGFIDISQNAKQLVFVGTLCGGATLAIADGRLSVTTEGSIRKFVPTVEQVSFNAAFSRRRGQPVMFVTERAVFALRPDGLCLTELAPGLRLREDVLDRIGFAVAVAADLRPMDHRIFRPGAMGLREEMGGGAVMADLRPHGLIAS